MLLNIWYILNPGDLCHIIAKFRCKSFKKLKTPILFDACGFVFIVTNAKYLRRFLNHNILETYPIEPKFRVEVCNRSMNDPSNFSTQSNEIYYPRLKTY